MFDRAALIEVIKRSVLNRETIIAIAVGGHDRQKQGWRGASRTAVVRCPATGREPGPAPSGMLSQCSRTSERDHLARIRLDLGAVRDTGVHQLASLLE
jgi:hypothetical protein